MNYSPVQKRLCELEFKSLCLCFAALSFLEGHGSFLTLVLKEILKQEKGEKKNFHAVYSVTLV